MSASERDCVAVVVVTFNSEALIPDLLASLPAGLEGVDWHLTVADNDSKDATVALLRRLAPDATVVETGRNAGYAAGINAAVAAARPHTAILVLNPDVRLRPGCVPALLETVATPDVGIAAPRLTDAAGELIESQRREPTVLRALGDAVLGARRAGRWSPLGEVVSDARRYTAPTTVDWAEGSTLLVHRRCWDRCGPWDEAFFLYSEETDYMLRARDAGLGTRYTPTAHAVHLEGGSAASPSLWALLTLNRVRLYRKRHGAVRSSAFYGAVLTRELSRAALGRPTSRAAVKMLLSPRNHRGPAGPHLLR